MMEIENEQEYLEKLLKVANELLEVKQAINKIVEIEKEFNIDILTFFECIRKYKDTACSTYFNLPNGDEVHTDCGFVDEFLDPIMEYSKRK